MNKITKKICKNEKGQSLVEFALVIPILIFILLAIIEYGWILNANITLTSATREGARIAAVSNLDLQSKALAAITKSTDGLSGLEINSVICTPDPDNNDISNIRNVVVEVTATINPIFNLFITDPVPLEARAVMRIE